MKKTVKKTASKKSVAKKPVMKSGGSTLKAVPAGNKGLSKLPTAVRNKMGYMKSGGPKRTLKKYQIEGEVMPPAPPASRDTGTAPVSDNQLIAMMIEKGMTPKQIRKFMKAKSKVAVNPNSVINAAGQIGSSLINAFGNRGGGGGGMMGPPDGPFKKGGAKKSTAKKPMMNDGGPTGIQNVRRKILTKRINNLDEKGIASQVAGNKEKAKRQFDKSDRLHEKRAALREKAGYKKGGAVKAVTKKTMTRTKKK